MGSALHTRLALVAELSDRRGRMGAARALARDIGAEDLVVFVRDAEVDTVLPALGFPQTLPDGRRWRAFVSRCAAGAEAVDDELPYPDEATVRRARGYGCAGDAVLVLLGGHPRREGIAELCALMPIVAAAFVAERAALVGETHASLARGRARELESMAATVANAQASLQASLMDQRRLMGEQELDARRKDEFLAMLAHELRNPLAALSGAGEVLRRAALDAGAAAAAEVVARQAATLARLVDDLLDLSRITRGVLELRRAPVDLAAVAVHALETTRALFEAGGHHLSAEPVAAPLPVFGDAVRLEQIVVNLLTNAARYTPRGGHVTVRLASSSGSAEVRVRDDGPGIAPEMLERIFEMFAQARDDEAMGSGGLGIGLTISRRLAAMHGGSLTASSAGPGRGSEFVLRVPLSTEAAPAATAGAPEQRVEHAPARLRILVVDDNRDNAEMTAAILQTWGHHVTVAYDGEDALSLASRQEHDVVITDLGLPRLDGYALAAALAGLPRPPRLIAVSGFGQESDRARTRAAGFSHHLLKPVDMEALRRSLTGP